MSGGRGEEGKLSERTSKCGGWKRPARGKGPESRFHLNEKLLWP